MVSRLARRVARAIRAQGLWAPGDRIAVALSGGADSVALSIVLAELALHARWTLAGLIHVNHNLRGLESAADEEFCRELAARLAVPIEVAAVNVSERRATTRESLETASRELRYAAFVEAAARLQASIVATAHTLDDQAETVLLRLLRGTSTRGLSAIRPRRGMVARPFLDVRRRDVVQHLTERRQPHREDLSNRDTTVPRNLLRHRLVPVLDELWPGGVKAVARFASLAAADESWLSGAAQRAASRLALRSEDGVELKRGPFARLPLALARRVVRDAIEQCGGRASSARVSAVVRLAGSDKRRMRLDLEGVSVSVGADVVQFRRCAPTPLDVPEAFLYELAVPGRTIVGETGTVFEASLSNEAGDTGTLRSSGARVVLQADKLAMPLAVRNRRPGDRLRPLGAPGTRRVQDLLVDRKVPAAERDQVPIVEDRNGQIVWVAGVALADRVRVTSPEASVVILKFKKDLA